MGTLSIDAIICHWGVQHLTKLDMEGVPVHSEGRTLEAGVGGGLHSVFKKG